MASTFRTPKVSLNMRSRPRYAAGLKGRGLSDMCEWPLARRNAASQTTPEVAEGA